jgi:hypothetical protein
MQMTQRVGRRAGAAALGSRRLGGRGATSTTAAPPPRNSVVAAAAAAGARRPNSSSSNGVGGSGGVNALAAAAAAVAGVRPAFADDLQDLACPAPPPAAQQAPATSALPPEIKAVLFSEQQVKDKVAAMAARICADYAGKKVAIIGVLAGAFIFTSGARGAAVGGAQGACLSEATAFLCARQPGMPHSVRVSGCV